MQVTLGTYAFPVNGVELTSRTRLVLSDTGVPVRYVTRVGVSGALEGDTQAELSALEQALREQCRRPYLDLRLLSDAGAAMSTSLLTADSLSGVRVVDGPNFPTTDGAEYATLRRFDLEVEAEFLVRDAARAVLSFQETVTIQGDGGPRFVMRVPLTGPGVRQKVSDRSLVRATQSGQAVGHTGYPPIPAPLWPKPALQGDQTQTSRRSPKRVGPLGLVEFGVSWSYQFETDVPLIGVPGIPPL